MEAVVEGQGAVGEVVVDAQGWPGTSRGCKWSNTAFTIAGVNSFDDSP